MPAAFPALGGFETEPRKILDRVFSSYLLTDASQSNDFKNAIISLPKRVQMFDGNEDNFVDAVRLDLESVLSRYEFDQLNVNVDYKSIDETPDHTLHVILKVSVIKLGRTYDLAKTISVSDSKSLQVIDTLNNS